MAKRRTVRALISATALGVQFSLCPLSQASAQVLTDGRHLTLDLAMEAAREAIRVCGDSGWPVSVAIVDASGNAILQAKGDHSAVHTRDASFRKAYTTVSYAPLFGFDKLGDWVAALRTNPLAASYATLPNIFLLPGAVAVRAGGEVIAAIGVGGAPGGDKDEVCAAAGLAKVKERLPP